MTKQEFEQLFGKETSQEDFERYNEIYMNAGDLDKQTFCNAVKNLNKLPLTLTLIETLSKTSTIRERRLKRYEKENYDAALLLIQIAVEHGNEAAREQAIKMLGTNEYLRAKINLGLPFDCDDYELVKDFL